MSEHDALLAELGINVDLHHDLMAAVDRAFRQTVGAQANRPAAMAYFDNVLHAAHGARVAELVEDRKRGRKLVGTFCIYVPDEVALAANMNPAPLCGGFQFSVPYAEAHFPRDICPLVKSTFGLAFSKTCPYGPIVDLMVGETTCDAKKKVWDVIADDAFHVMELPQKKEPLDAELWRDSVRRFAAKCEEVSGTRIDAAGLAAAVKVMNAKRRELARLAGLRRADPPPISGLDALVVMQAALADEPVRFTRAVRALNDEMEKHRSPLRAGRPRILFAGCPSVMGNWKVHAAIEQAGGTVVADESCTGSRYFEHLVDETARDLAGTMDAVADRYFKIDCSCFTPNQERIADVVKKAQEYRAAGVVQYVLQTCHTYNIEALRVEGALKEAGIPSLKIVTDYSEEDQGQLRTRIEAFLEQLG